MPNVISGAITSLGNRIFIIGGYPQANDTTYDEIHLFNLSSKCFIGPINYKYDKYINIGYKGGSSATSNNYKIYLFGGFNGNE